MSKVARRSLRSNTNLSDINLFHLDDNQCTTQVPCVAKDAKASASTPTLGTTQVSRPAPGMFSPADLQSVSSGYTTSFPPLQTHALSNTSTTLTTPISTAGFTYPNALNFNSALIPDIRMTASQQGSQKSVQQSVSVPSQPIGLSMLTTAQSPAPSQALVLNPGYIPTVESNKVCRQSAMTQ